MADRPLTRQTLTVYATPAGRPALADALEQAAAGLCLISAAGTAAAGITTQEDPYD